MLLHNKIKNTEITAKYADNAELIFGPNIGTLHGKTICWCPKRIIIPTYLPSGIPDDVLHTIQQVILSSDIFYVDQLKFLVTLSRKLHFATVKYITVRKHDTIFEALENTISLYAYFKFKVCTLLTDSKYVGLKNRLLCLGVLLNLSATHEHVGEIECFICVIKERVRGIITTLPFENFPRTLKREIIYFTVVVVLKNCENIEQDISITSEMASNLTISSLQGRVYKLKTLLTQW